MKYTVRQLDAMPVGTVLFPPKNRGIRYVKLAKRAWRQVVTYRDAVTGELEGYLAPASWPSEVAEWDFTHIATPTPTDPEPAL